MSKRANHWISCWLRIFLFAGLLASPAAVADTVYNVSVPTANSTGVRVCHVCAGQTVIVSASGLIQYFPTCNGGANAGNKIGPGGHYVCMMARFESDGNSFGNCNAAGTCDKTGKSPDVTIPTPQGGDLWLYCFDSYYPDNVGEWNATVTVQNSTSAGSSGCSGCGSSGSVGGSTYNNKCIQVSINLGSTLYGQVNAQLNLRGTVPTTNLYTPASLQVLYPVSNNFTVVTNMNGSLRQFLGPLALVDVVADSAYSYDIKFYTNQPGLYVTNSSGIFTPSGSAFKTITVSNPDLTSTSQLQFVENAYGSVTTNLYVWNPGANDWTLYSGNGLRSESRSQYWQGIFCTETNELWDSQGHIVFRQAEKFQVLTNGCTNLIERVSDPTGTHPATNSWLYTDTGLLVFEQGPYGNWTRYQYDANGNPTATVFCVGDAPTNAPNNQCRVESVQYGEAVLTNVVVSVNPTNSSMLIFTTNVVIQKYSLNCTTLLGQEVARQYNFTCLANQNSQTNYTYACQNMGANLSDPSNLLTCTVMPLGGLFAYQPSVVYHPNGTVSCYTYTNSLDGLLNTTILESGAANNLGVVIDGNRRSKYRGYNTEKFHQLYG